MFSRQGFLTLLYAALAGLYALSSLFGDREYVSVLVAVVYLVVAFTAYTRND